MVNQDNESALNSIKFQLKYLETYEKARQEYVAHSISDSSDDYGYGYDEYTEHSEKLSFERIQRKREKQAAELWKKMDHWLTDEIVKGNACGFPKNRMLFIDAEITSESGRVEHKFSVYMDNARELKACMDGVFHRTDYGVPEGTYGTFRYFSGLGNAVLRAEAKRAVLHPKYFLTALVCGGLFFLLKLLSDYLGGSGALSVLLSPLWVVSLLLPVAAVIALFAAIADLFGTIGKLRNDPTAEARKAVPPHMLSGAKKIYAYYADWYASCKDSSDKEFKSNFESALDDMKSVIEGYEDYAKIKE